MKAVVLVLGLALAVSTPAIAQEPAAPAVINLVCIGLASKDETVGTALDLLAGEARTERVASEDSVYFEIQPDNSGSARLPKRLQSAYKEANKDGSFRLVEVVKSENEIAGKVRLHGMYKPRFRLDRITGQVVLNGNLGDFAGTCRAFDPASVERKF